MAHIAVLHRDTSYMDVTHEVILMRDHLKVFIPEVVLLAIINAINLPMNLFS